MLGNKARVVWVAELSRPAGHCGVGNKGRLGLARAVAGCVVPLRRAQAQSSESWGEGILCEFYLLLLPNPVPGSGEAWSRELPGGRAGRLFPEPRHPCSL